MVFKSTNSEFKPPMQGEKTGLRGTIALFRWSCAVCQIVLEKKITLSGGSVRIK